MCEFCEGKSQSKRAIVTGPWVSLNAGIDNNFQLFFQAEAEDVTERYYPKYCPECGRLLEET